MAVAGQMQSLTLFVQSCCWWPLKPPPAPAAGKGNRDHHFPLLTRYKYLPSYHVGSDSCI